jgi:undecaprenyl phosphate-alpha-L-ara4N flippase subunit ArnE
MKVGGEGGAATAPVAGKLSSAGWLLNPYLLIFVGALLDTTGEVLLKKGANSVAGSGGVAAAMGLTPLLSGWTWLGIVSYVTSLVSWLYVLRTVPLSIAFPLINVVHVFVPLGAAVFLHEHVSFRRWAGIALILLGVIAIVKPVERAEKKL